MGRSVQAKPVELEFYCKPCAVRCTIPEPAGKTIDGWECPQCHGPMALVFQALTLWQPYASLMAIGAKGVETRMWSTPYRGPLAIHAARTFKREQMDLCREAPFCDVLREAGLRTLRHVMDLCGHVVATCRLVRVEQFVGCPCASLLLPGEPCGLPGHAPNERAFGDFTAGRYGWHVANVRRLDPPLLASGHQKLWAWVP